MAYKRSIFLSPKLLEKPDTIQLYIAHELSHLHLQQHIGDYAYRCIPSWFLEGLAAFVSDGGGAEKVTDDDVKVSIISGNHFTPFENAGLRDLFQGMPTILELNISLNITYSIASVSYLLHF